MQNGLGRVHSNVNIPDLEVMEAIQQRIQVFTDRISVEHERVEDQLVSKPDKK
jgi:hypothetical protein